MKKKGLYIACGIGALVGLFFISYSLTNLYYSQKWAEEYNKKQDSEFVAASAEQKELKDDMIIVKETNGAIEEIKVSDYKKDNNITGALNKKILTERLTEDGYEFRTEDDKTINYVSKNKKTKIEENKYYLGEHEGKLAILKGDSEGNAKLETDEDLTAKSISELQEQDQNNIRNFTKVYNSKEDAKEAITDFIS